MHSLGVLDQTFADGLIRRLLHKAQLDILDRKSPQDGTVVFPWLPEQRIRVSVVGDLQGQYLALRLLGRAVQGLSVLGYEASAITRLRHAASCRDGLVLFAGPTGSGKTTGMAALLAEIAGVSRKVLSLEDPVEYRIPGVVQIERSTEQLNGELIAAALRQDPDVLAFGEIRKSDHVRQLEEAILSGHLVVSSIHGFNREGTLNRLVALGMSEAIARRYCRALCCQRLEGDPLQLEASVEELPWQ